MLIFYLLLWSCGGVFCSPRPVVISTPPKLDGPLLGTPYSAFDNKTILLINGIERPELTLSRGQHYSFFVETECSFFITQKVGPNFKQYLYHETKDGVKLLGEDGISSGSFEWNVSSSAPDVLYYVCGSFENRIIINDTASFLSVWSEGHYVPPGGVISISHPYSNISVDLINSGGASVTLRNITIAPSTCQLVLPSIPFNVPAYHLASLHIRPISTCFISIYSTDLQFEYPLTISFPSPTTPIILSSTLTYTIVAISLLILLLLIVAVLITYRIMNKIYFTVENEEEADILGEEFNETGESQVVLEERVTDEML